MSLDEKMKYDKCNSDKFIPNYYTNNPNESKMIDVFMLCHTKLLPNASLSIRKISILF